LRSGIAQLIVSFAPPRLAEIRSSPFIRSLRAEISLSLEP